MDDCYRLIGVYHISVYENCYSAVTENSKFIAIFEYEYLLVLFIVLRWSYSYIIKCSLLASGWLFK